jgi:hypothetical protein
MECTLQYCCDFEGAMELIRPSLTQIIHQAVIPAKAGIQMTKNFPPSGATSWFCPLRGVFFVAGFRPSPE